MCIETSVIEKAKQMLMTVDGVTNVSSHQYTALIIATKTKGKKEDVYRMEEKIMREFPLIEFNFRCRKEVNEL